MNLFSKLFALALLCATCAVSGAQTVTLDVQDDVWNYPFNFTTGSRANGTLFAAELTFGPQLFNFHDGVIISRFGPDGSTPEYTAGLPASSYDFDTAVVTFNHSSSNAISEPAYTWELGVDAGTAYFGTTPTLYLNIHGVGSDVVDLSTWTESTTYVGLAGAPLGIARDPYSLNIDDAASTPSVSESFIPTSWGAVTVDNAYTPGVANANPFAVDFTLDVSNSRVKTYIQEGLASGRLFFSLISNAQASQGGAGNGIPRFELNGFGGPGSNPNAATITFTNFSDGSASVHNWSAYQ